MRNSTQANERNLFRVPGDRKGLAGGWAGLLCVGVLALAGPRTGLAQTMRLGMIDWFLQAKTDVAYDSNVDGAYPEDLDPERAHSDFYWMPSLSLRSVPWVLAPRTTFNLDAGVAYQDYFKRNDLDTALYKAGLTFQTANPRAGIGGMASTEYTADSQAETYVPGGVGRDPTLTQSASVFGNLLYRALRLEGNASFTSERHDYERYWEGDQDETAFSAGAVFNPLTKLTLNGSWEKTFTLLTLLDEETEETGYGAGATFNLFSWGGLYYEWERTVTIERPSEMTTEDTTSSFGLTGTIPVELWRHPQITYSFGTAYEEKTEDSGEVTKTWEPVHTIMASDDYQISRSLRLAGNATWDSQVADDEISFVYNVMLEHILTPSIRHAVTMTREPEPTFGSTSETDSTAFGYDFSWNDFVFDNLTMSFNATYEENTPLGDEDPETEKTTNYTFRLAHVRQLTRKLSRTLSYEYTWENSNFHENGANEKHLVVYAFTYDF